jgi:tetratricopeptide (TPR) repeat protein
MFPDRSATTMPSLHEDYEADAQVSLMQLDLRHASHYMGLLLHANRLYERGREHSRKALALFEEERSSIEVAFGRAAAYAAENLAAADLCCHFYEAGARLFYLRLHPLTHIRWAEDAVAAARRCRDRRAESHCLGGLGVACAAVGDFRRAMESLQKRLEMARGDGDREGEATTLGNMVTIHTKLGEARRAVACHEQQLSILRGLGRPQAELKVLGNLANAYADLGEAGRAIEYNEQALLIARELGDDYKIGRASCRERVSVYV